MREAIAQARAQQDAVRERLTAPFPMAGMLADKAARDPRLEAQLAAGPAGEALDEESAIGAAGERHGAADRCEPLARIGPGISASRAQRVADRIKAALGGCRRSADGNPRASRATTEPMRSCWRSCAAAAPRGTCTRRCTKGPSTCSPITCVTRRRSSTCWPSMRRARGGLRGLLGNDLVPRMRAISSRTRICGSAWRPCWRRTTAASLAEAVEEVLVDTPSADLAKLRGWRAVVGRMVRWLADHGFELTAARLARWLKGTLGEQEQADLYAANLQVRAAREFVTRQRTVPAADTRLPSVATAVPAPAPEQKKIARERRRDQSPRSAPGARGC